MIDLLPSRSDLSGIECHILQVVKTVRFGSVVVIIHDGRIVQVERNQKIRFDPTGNTLVVNFDSEVGRYDIVDGQQRLTSIVLLMRCLWPEIEKFDPETARGIYERYIRRGGIGNETLTLQLGSDNREGKLSCLRS